MTLAPVASDKLTLKTKLAFGVGSAAETIALFAVASYALLFYNQVLGVKASWVGLAISASLIMDGIVDPVVGSWSDRTTNTKWGRRHPWMFAAPIPIAICFFAIFNPPRGLDSLGLAIWCGVSVSLMRQFMAVFHTPHLALGGELSPHYTERSKVMSYNNFFTWAGGSAMSYIALTFFFPKSAQFHNGLLNPEPWSQFGATMAIGVVAILFVSAWFTRDRIPFLPKPALETPKFSPAEFFKDVVKAVSNRNYLWLLIAFFFLSMMLGVREVLRLYVLSFYWGISSSDLRYYIIGSFVGFLAAFLFSARLHGRFDKKVVIIAGALGLAIVPAIPIVFGQMGFLNSATTGLLPLLITLSAGSACAGAVLNIGVNSALADIADENELKHGIRQEGIFFSTRAFAGKLDQAMGIALAGFVIDFIQFPAKAKPGLVPDETLFNLALFDGAIATIPGLIAAACYARYRINRQSYEATRVALVLQRQQAAAVAG